MKSFREFLSGWDDSYRRRAGAARSRQYLAPPPPGSRLVRQNQFHVVENNGGSLEAIAKNITSVFWPCSRRTLAWTLMFREPVAC